MLFVSPMTRNPTFHSFSKVKAYVSLLSLAILLFYLQIIIFCIRVAGLFIQTGCLKSSKIISQPSQHSKLHNYNEKSHDRTFSFWKSKNMLLIELINVQKHPFQTSLKFHRFSKIRAFAEQVSFTKYLPSLLISPAAV